MIYDIDEERFERGLRDFENAIVKCCAKHNIEWNANISGASAEKSAEAAAYAKKGKLAAQAAEKAQAWLDEDQAAKHSLQESHSSIGFGHASKVIAANVQAKDVLEDTQYMDGEGDEI